MSNTDSFIDEVSEEVRRDHLYGLFRKYGWIAVTAVVLIVGGASYNEVRKANEAASAEATGDALLNALDANESADRVEALQAATLESPSAEVIRQFLLSAEQVNAEEAVAASESLDAFLASGSEVSPIYRDLAELKLLMTAGDSLSADDRRARFEALAQPGAPLALLASEQIALLDIEALDTVAAIDRLQAIILDAEATTGLRQRASQLIVALGGEPETLPSLIAQ